jgi:hypothetical protein
MTEEQRLRALARGKKWREANRERYLALHADAMRRFRAKHPGHDNEWRREWRAANPEKVQEINRKAAKKYYAANRSQENERSRQWRADHPDYFKDRRDKGRDYERRYREANPNRRPWQKRRMAKAGIILVVKVDSADCGVCFTPLIDVPYPDPQATTVGHEPPLSVAIREGWRIIVERPEHLRCNLQKGSRMDYELPIHATFRVNASIHDTIAAAARWAPPVRYL